MLIHAGSAISRLDEDEALETIELMGMPVPRPGYAMNRGGLEEFSNRDIVRGRVDAGGRP